MMALKQCEECGNTVSNRAKTCPHCGAKVKKSRWGTVILFALIVGACVISIPIMVGRHNIVAEQKDTGVERNLKLAVEETVKERLSEDYGVQCVSIDLLEGSDGSFSGEAKLEDGREIDIDDARIDGEMIRWNQIIKKGYEYKCKHHIDKLKLIASPEDEGQGILFGELWNDGSEPIRGFIVAEFIDDNDNVNQRYRITVPFPPSGAEMFDWIPPGKSSEIKYPVSSEILKENLVKVRAEFFNLGNEPLASIRQGSFDESFLTSIPVKVTSQIYKIQKERANSKEWQKIQEEFDNYNVGRILTNILS
jgi:hypothetical protein